MDKTYLIVNPFPSGAGHGIDNYIINLIDALQQKSIPYDLFSNDAGLKPDRFRWSVKNYVESSYGVDEVFIEAPEVKAPTLLLSNDYDVHVRLHTPGAIAQKYDNAKIDERLFSEELLAIHKAKYVSSPSYGLLRELAGDLRRSDFHVYKNPPISVEPRLGDRPYDLVFMGRFQPLKGVSYINSILAGLPESFSVLLIGKNSTRFKLSPAVKCRVKTIEEIKGPERFDLVSSSKVLMQLSRFENCSMVILEALACKTVVAAWDVGGNSEIAPPPVLRIVPFEDTREMARVIIDSVELRDQGGVSDITFDHALEKIRTDFNSGVESVYRQEGHKYLGLDYRHSHKDSGALPPKRLDGSEAENHVSHDASYRRFGTRIFGFSVSNEHIEEMWAPIVNKFGADYRYVCRRPLGFMYKFGSPAPVDPSKYKTYDWIRYPNLLLEDIREFKPHKILFHNGLHPMYQDVLERVKRAFPDIPFIYSELGWFPQNGTIYFDPWGTNGKSRLARLSFREFCGEEMPPRPKRDMKVQAGYVLVVTQLENDTNLIVNSRRFKKMENFVSYVIEEIGSDYNIVVKTHPLDKNRDRFDRFGSDRVQVVHDADMVDLFRGASSVVGINSTVLLEALQYDVNIYMFGDGLLSNKGVVKEMAHEDRSLSRVWEDTLFASREAKDMLVAGFVDRQIEVGTVKHSTVAECIEKKAFEPLLDEGARYTNKIEFEMLVAQKFKGSDDHKALNDMMEVLRRLENQTRTLTNIVQKRSMGPSKTPPRIIRRARKLLRKPRAFFEDSRFFVLRPFGMLFPKT